MSELDDHKSISVEEVARSISEELYSAGCLNDTLNASGVYRERANLIIAKQLRDYFKLMDYLFATNSRLHRELLESLTARMRDGREQVKP